MKLNTSAIGNELKPNNTRQSSGTQKPRRVSQKGKGGGGGALRDLGIYKNHKGDYGGSSLEKP